MINSFSRYQAGLTLNRLFPAENGECACGCGQSLTGRKTKWASVACRTQAYIHFAIVKGDTRVIREQLYLIDGGHCRECGVFDDQWEADHIVPVQFGGGACGLENLQTLCRDCHREKSKPRPTKEKSPCTRFQSDLAVASMT